MSVASPGPFSLDELASRFGDMPVWRIRTNPPPGTATEEDVIRVQDHEDRTCELIDGVLVEKAVSFEASLIARFLGEILGAFVRSRRLGFVAGADGLMRLTDGRLRAPDVSFVRRDQTPGGRAPKRPVPELYPTLAVEVLSPGNTKREMREKLDDYFASGTELVWIVDPASKTVRVYTGRDAETVLRSGETLTGGDVLPGFSVPVADIFAVLELGDE
jgi:Uma2 family endonuclease